MLTILGSPLLLFGVVPAVLIAMGFGIGAAIGRTPQKWKIALGLLLAPPALVGVFYFLASQGGCAGGTCMGPMIGLFLLGGLAALVMLIALGIFLQTAFSALAQ